MISKVNETPVYLFGATSEVADVQITTYALRSDEETPSDGIDSSSRDERDEEGGNPPRPTPASASHATLPESGVWTQKYSVKTFSLTAVPP